MKAEPRTTVPIACRMIAARSLPEREAGCSATVRSTQPSPNPTATALERISKASRSFPFRLHVLPSGSPALSFHAPQRIVTGKMTFLSIDWFFNVGQHHRILQIRVFLLKIATENMLPDILLDLLGGP